MNFVLERAFPILQKDHFIKEKANFLRAILTVLILNLPKVFNPSSVHGEHAEREFLEKSLWNKKHMSDLKSLNVITDKINRKANGVKATQKYEGEEKNSWKVSGTLNKKKLRPIFRVNSVGKVQPTDNSFNLAVKMQSNKNLLH